MFLMYISFMKIFNKDLSEYKTPPEVKVPEDDNREKISEKMRSLIEYELENLIEDDRFRYILPNILVTIYYQSSMTKSEIISAFGRDETIDYVFEHAYDYYKYIEWHNGAVSLSEKGISLIEKAAENKRNELLNIVKNMAKLNDPKNIAEAEAYHKKVSTLTAKDLLEEFTV